MNAPTRIAGFLLTVGLWLPNLGCRTPSVPDPRAQPTTVEPPPIDARVVANEAPLRRITAVAPPGEIPTTPDPDLKKLRTALEEIEETKLGNSQADHWD